MNATSANQHGYNPFEDGSMDAYLRAVPEPTEAERRAARVAAAEAALRAGWTGGLVDVLAALGLD